MAVTANGAGQPASRHTIGLVNLAALLLICCAVAVSSSIYLLHLDQSSKVTVVLPAPYRVLMRSGTTLVSIDTSGRSHQALLNGVPAGLKALLAEPGGRGMVAVATASGADRLYLVRAYNRRAELLPQPSPKYGKGPWRDVANTWIGSTDVVALLAGVHSPGSGVLVWYSVDSSPAHIERVVRLPRESAQLVSLTPNAREVARLDTLPSTGGFDAQGVIELHQVFGKAASTALRYLGESMPGAIIWSPDGGTLAVQILGQGLAIRKSSGRPVQVAPNSTNPAAFSPRGASLAYMSQSTTVSSRPWRIHVLNLHGELDSVLSPPAGGTPTLLDWTPDARALIYGVGHALWQIDPATGVSTQLASLVSGSLVAVIPATSPLAF